MMNVVDYLRNTLGLEVIEGGNLDAVKGKLPLYLRNIPDQEIFIGGRRIILEYKKSVAGSTAEQLEKQKIFLENALGAPIVFCFESLASFERKRLMERHISFIVPGKQVYIPALIINLNEFIDLQVKKKDHLSPVSQFLLLYHLSKQSLEGISFGRVAHLINYSSMSVTRVVKELREKQLCKESGGKTKSIVFQRQGKQLWEAALPYLQSPIKKKLYTPHLPMMVGAVKSGDTALELYTNLSGMRTATFAVSERIMRAKTPMTEYYPSEFGGSVCIEIWKYEAALLSRDDVVDPLSLYLCFRNEEDERVQRVLPELLECVHW